MPRLPRYHVPGGIYHVIVRGNDRQRLFYSDGDRYRLCFLLQEGVERFGHQVLAFCFMDNHVHLAIRAGETSISIGVQNFTFRFANFVNSRNDRSGHLFQGRFRSILVDSRAYLNELVRYIHLNPVRAGLVDAPEKYMWSSHRSYLGLAPIAWVECSPVLKQVSDDLEKAREMFDEYVLAGIGREREIDFNKGIEKGILGDKDYRSQVLREVNAQITAEIDYMDVIVPVAFAYGVDPQRVISPGKDHEISRIRSIVAYLVRKITGLTMVGLSAILGRSPSTLSGLANRVERGTLRSAEYAGEVEMLIDLISENRKTEA